MNEIKCDFCGKENLFDDDRIKTSGNAKLLRCEYCQRSITLAFKDKIYYEKIVDKI